MKVFISWSGTKSHEVAKLLQQWISCVVQSSDPWLSSNNIDAGTVWFSEIQNQLADTSIGIICLTKSNKEKPWILFEAGALAKGISTNKVVVLLCDLNASDIRPPLSQFNCITPDQEGMKKLFRTINSHNPPEALKQDILEKAFNVYWNEFSDNLKEIIASQDDSQNIPERPEEDVIGEILALTRSMSSRISNLESTSLKMNKSIMESEEIINRSKNFFGYKSLKDVDICEDKDIPPNYLYIKHNNKK